MSAVTEEGTGASSSEQAQTPPEGKRQDPRVSRAERIGGGDPGLTNVVHASQGAVLEDEEEVSALDYLLGAQAPTIHEITVQYETAKGMVPLVFVVKSIDTRKIDKIETRHLDTNTGTLDRLSADCEIVCLATMHMRDSKGREVALNSDEFLTVQRRARDTGELESVKLAAPPMALEQRFRDQMGLITGVSNEIKRAAGFSGERVGRAKRVSQAQNLLVGASLG